MDFAVSLIIPIYNEEKRIAAGLKEALRYLSRTSYRTQLILVDDGSTDKTAVLAKELTRNYRYTEILSHTHNQGKGAAIRTGMKAATGRYLIFTDVDFSTPITELTKLLDALKYADIAIGVRRSKTSKILTHQSKIREFLGHIFTSLARNMLTPGIVDTTCGFKGYKAAVAKDLYKRARIKRWAFDAEILFLAIKRHYKIAQIPVIWANTQGSKVHIIRDGLRSLYDMFQIRANYNAGRYGLGDEKKFQVH